MSDRRIVEVFIVDPDENVPAEDALIYQGERRFTDLTDEELFFEIGVKGWLETHNERRVKILDKEKSIQFGRDIYLEPARIRDLKMLVVVIARF